MKLYDQITFGEREQIALLHADLAISDEHWGGTKVQSVERLPATQTLTAATAHHQKPSGIHVQVQG